MLISRLCVLAALCAVFFLAVPALGLRKPSPSPSPTLPKLERVRYIHNWADSSGQTHFATCFLTNYTLQGVLANSNPNFVNSGFASSGASLVLYQSPVGWTGSWHTNPYPQLVIVQEGMGLWTSSDNTTDILAKGDLYFGEDQRSAIGHTSKNIGHTPLNLLLIQFRTWTPTVDKPCWLK